MGRPYSLGTTLHALVHRGYSQIQRYTQAGMGDYSLTEISVRVGDLILVAAILAAGVISSSAQEWGDSQSFSNETQ